MLLSVNRKPIFPLEAYWSIKHAHFIWLRMVQGRMWFEKNQEVANISNCKKTLKHMVMYYFFILSLYNQKLHCMFNDYDVVNSHKAHCNNEVERQWLIFFKIFKKTKS